MKNKNKKEIQDMYNELMEMFIIRYTFATEIDGKFYIPINSISEAIPSEVLSMLSKENIEVYTTYNIDDKTNPFPELFSKTPKHDETYYAFDVTVFIGKLKETFNIK